MTSLDLNPRPIVAEPRLISAQPDRLPWSGELRRAKLRVPGLPADVVARPRLLHRFDEEGRPLTLVVAPAGFGKTTFAAQWAMLGSPTAWLSIDHRDNVLDRFWAHLREALLTTDAIPADLGEIVSAALAMPHRASALDLGRLFADELLDVSVARIVLDDLHLVTDREVHDFQTGLLEMAPSGLHLVITSRVEPPLPLNRMRLRGAIREIRGDDLLFTESEVETFLVQANPEIRNPSDVLGPGPDGVRSSGWAASLRLIALSRAQSVGAAGHERAAESEQELLAWLLEETLAGRSRDERAVLLRAALSERFNPRLVMAMAGESLPADIVRDAIEFAARAALCRRSVRNDGDWLEFHPLFRDTLRQQLASEIEPQALRELHARAATWLEETGYFDEAIDHLLAAGDHAAAVAIVVRETRPALNREDWPSIARWLAKLPGEIIQQTPRLLLAQGMIAQFRGQPVALAEIQLALEAQLAHGEISTAEIATLRGEFDSLRLNSSYSDSIDVRSSLETAQRAIQRIDPARRFELGVAWMHFGGALVAMGKYQQAIQRLEGWIEEAGPVIDAGVMRGYLGLLLIHAQVGNLALGKATAHTAIPLAETHGLRTMAGWGHRFLGDVLYETNDLEGAIEHYSAIARDYKHAHLKGVREALFGLALSYRALGRQDEAERALRRARDIATAAGLLHDLPILEAKQAYLSLLNNNVAAAEQWASVHEPTLGCESFGVLVHPAVIRAAILCSSADPRAVAHGLRDLERIRREMTYWACWGPLVRVDALRAVALLKSGRRDAAIEAMRAACATARPNGHVRTFLDVHVVFPREVENLAASVILPTAAQQALRLAGEPSSSRNQSSPDAALLETLTEREQEVLGYLSQRFSYREIGDQLYISPHTVKRHVTSIYSKLDVSGRLEAIQMAHELGWTA